MMNLIHKLLNWLNQPQPAKKKTSVPSKGVWPGKSTPKKKLTVKKKKNKKKKVR